MDGSARPISSADQPNTRAANARSDHVQLRDATWDGAALARAPRMREWWDIMEAMQVPEPDREPGTWWTNMEEVFHQD